MGDTGDGREVMLRTLRELVANRMLPDELADLDRGDNELRWKMHLHGGRVGFMNDTLRDSPEEAFTDALALLADVRDLGWHLGPASRLSAATATSAGQTVSGFRAHLDLSLHAEALRDQSHLEL